MRYLPVVHGQQVLGAMNATSLIQQHSASPTALTVACGISSQHDLTGLIQATAKTQQLQHAGSQPDQHQQRGHGDCRYAASVKTFTEHGGQCCIEPHHLSASQAFPSRHHRVRVKRYGVDTLVPQPQRKIWVVARALATNTNVLALL
jgi:hypothetical protein